MEFVELLMLTIAVLLIIFKPEKEKWAWWLTVAGWAVVASCTSVTFRPAFSAYSICNRGG